MMIPFAFPLLAAAMAMGGGAPAIQADAPKPAEARIAFAGSVRDFRADSRDVIYLRAGRQWYRGTFFAPCHELPWAWNVRFDNPGMQTGVDRYTTVIVRGERCQLDSLVKIDGEPPVKKKAKGKPAS